MKPETAADLAQVVADLNRSAQTHGRAPRWMPTPSAKSATPPARSLAEALGLKPAPKGRPKSKTRRAPAQGKRK